MKISGAGFLLAGAIILSGCGSDSDSSTPGAPSSLSEAVAAFGCVSGDAAITGCWVTQQCDEAVLDGGISLGRWVNRVYNFMADGTTKSIELQYDNAECSGEPGFSPPSPSPDPLTITEMGVYPSGSGYDVFGIELTNTLTNDNYGAAYYVTDTSELCFSDNIVLGALYSSFDQINQNSVIDFNHCLLPIVS